MNKIKLSLLDFGERDNENFISSIEDIVNYAIEADNLNFSRFWLAEHHELNTKNIYTNPDILITLIAGSTDKIRVGSGGALIGYYPPYLLACNYKLLNNIFNDRIDFGLAKGRPSNVKFHDYFRLKEDSHINLFSKNLTSINELFENEVTNFNEKEIVIPPFLGKKPSLWYLSTSYKDFDLAIEKKYNYCRSLFHGLDKLNKNFEKDKLLFFKDNFFNKNGYYPETAIAIAFSFTYTDDEIIQYENKLLNIPGALKIINLNIDSLFNLLKEYQELYGIDEFILLDKEPNNITRINNIKMISKKFEL